MNEPDQLRQIFTGALAVDTAEERQKFLEEACGEDLELLQRVEALLSAHNEAGSFMEEDVDPEATQLLAGVSESVGTEIGPYKLIEQIGEGGMGVVFRAAQSKPVKREVALKVIKPGMDSKEVISRFEAERQALAMMDHPHIAKVLDAGTTESGRPFFVMELVKGWPITKFCDREQLSLTERLNLFRTVCEAVQHAHQKGIIHRDIKPSNVLVSVSNGKPSVKVIDFGVAKALFHKLTDNTLWTSLQQVVGTPMYMSPEQADQAGAGYDIDTRTDIYSLGVLLYELLTGSTPFSGEELHKAGIDEIRRIIREQEPAKPSTKISTLGETLPSVAAVRKLEPKRLSAFMRGDLDWIVMKALEKDRERRYTTANAFAEDLERYLEHEPVEAGPPSRIYRFRKFARRNRAVIGTTGALALVLISGVVGTSLQAYRATKAERVAEDRLSIVETQKETIEQEQRKVKKEAAIAKAVNEFLKEDLLAMTDAQLQAEAKLTPDPNLKLRTVLDRAAESIEGRFSDQPLVEASIQQTIGKAYRSIGLYKDAEQHSQRSLEIHRQQLGEEHASTLSSMNSLADAYKDQGRYVEAERLYQRTLEIQERTLGDNHSKTLASMINVANVYKDQGRYDEAERIYQQTLEIIQETLGNDHPQSLASIYNYATLCYRQGRYEEAEQLLQKTLEIEQRKWGDEHPDTFDSMHALAHVYGALGQYEKAEKLHLQTLKIQRRTLGEDHPDTLSSMNSLASIYDDQSRYTEAQQLYEQTLEVLRRTLRDEHPLTLACMHNLALIYQNQAHYDDAERLMQQTLEIERRTFGDEHPSTLNSMNNLGILYMVQGQYDEAKQLHQETLEIKRRTLGNEHPLTLASMHNLALLYNNQDRYDEAESLYQQTLKIQRRILGDEHPDTLRSMLNLALLYNNQDRYDEAESLYQQTLELRRRILGEEHHETLKAMSLLGNLYLNQDRYAEAEQLHQKTLEILRRTLGEEHPDTLISMNNQAVALRKLRRYEEAEKLRRSLVEISTRVWGEDHPSTKFYQKNLALFYTSTAWHLATDANLKDRDPTKAVQMAQTALELHDHSNNWNNLGVALHRNGEFQEAVEAFQKADEMFEGKDRKHRPFLAMSLWQLDRKEEALQNARQYIAWYLSGDRGNEQKRFLAEMEELLGLSPEERQQTALDYYQSVLDDDPQNQEALKERIALLGNLKLWQQQIDDLQTLLELTPDDASRWNQLAWAHQQLQQSADALKAADRAIAANPEDTTGHIRRASALSSLEEYEGAVESATRALELDPEKLQSYSTRAQAFIRLGQWSNALRDYQHVNQHGNPNQYTFLYEAVLHVKVGNLSGYQQLCQRMLEKYLEQPSAKYAEYMLETCGYAELPPELLSQLIDIGEEQLTQNPKRSALFRHLGILFCRQGDYERAAELFAMARELGDGSHAIQIWTAIAEYQLGHTLKAQEWFSRIPETFPSGPEDWNVRRAKLQLPLYRQEAEALIPMPLKAPKPELVRAD